MKLTMNETRKAVLNTLLGEEKLTLNEIAEKCGLAEIKTGTTNAMVSAGLIKAVGKKKVAKVVYVEVNEYAIDNIEKVNEFLK